LNRSRDIATTSGSWRVPRARGPTTPTKGPAETWEAERLDVTRAALEAFAVAAQGGDPYPMSFDDMTHGASVAEAVVRSAASGAVEKVA